MSATALRDSHSILSLALYCSALSRTMIRVDSQFKISLCASISLTLIISHGIQRSREFVRKESKKKLVFYFLIFFRSTKKNKKKKKWNFHFITAAKEKKKKKEVREGKERGSESEWVREKWNLMRKKIWIINTIMIIKQRRIRWHANEGRLFFLLLLHFLSCFYHLDFVVLEIFFSSSSFFGVCLSNIATGSLMKLSEYIKWHRVFFSPV